MRPTSTKDRPYDPEAAKDLLAAAGYPEGFGVTLDCTNNSNMNNDETICRAIATQLGEVGIDVVVNAQSKDVIYPEDQQPANWTSTSTASPPWTLDWHEVFINLYRTKGRLEMRLAISNPRVDELIETTRERRWSLTARDAMIEEVWKKRARGHRLYPAASSGHRLGDAR